MTNDPMDGLSLPVVPIAPRPEFMTSLRRRVFEGLGVPLSATGREAGMTDITARPLVTPALHYRDATEAVRWLTNTLGLERSWVYPETGRIQHAELRWGSGVVLVSYKRGLYEDRGPTFVSLAVESDAELEARYERAVAAGAETVEPITENWDHRGRYFIVRDAEGTMWQLTTA